MARDPGPRHNLPGLHYGAILGGSRTKKTSPEGWKVEAAQFPQFELSYLPSSTHTLGLGQWMRVFAPPPRRPQGSSHDVRRRARSVERAPHGIATGRPGRNVAWDFVLEKMIAVIFR